MTRIVGGEWGGRRVSVPSAGVRPTSERVRESVCNRIEHLVGGLAELTALDIYAGSGAVGLELLSRGLSQAVFVEQDRGVLRVLRDNIASLKAETAEVLPVSAERVAERLQDKFDIVFMDPPYEVPTARILSVVRGLVSGDCIAENGLVVVELARRSGPFEWPDAIQSIDYRDYGDTRVWYGQMSPFPVTE